MCHHAARCPRVHFGCPKMETPQKKAMVPFWLSFPLFEQTSRVLGCSRKTRPLAGEIVMTMCQLLCSLHHSVTDPLPLVSARYVQFNMHGCMCVCHPGEAASSLWRAQVGMLFSLLAAQHVHGDELPLFSSCVSAG